MTGRLSVLMSLLLGALFIGAPTSQAVVRTPLPVGTDADYQLGGARWMPHHVGIVVRDRRAQPQPGRYNVCYVNGFQTQPDERAFWRNRRWLVLHQGGKPVLDEAWNEMLLDVRTPAKRQRLAQIFGGWTRTCAADGYDAVEYDNLDSFTRSHGLIRRAQAVAFARLLVETAHAAGLSAGQKNLADFDGRTVGYDFAVAEECGRWHECSAYVSHYGRRVLVIEYRSQDFRQTCSHWADRLAVVLRDLDLSPGGIHRWC